LGTVLTGLICLLAQRLQQERLVLQQEQQLALLLLQVPLFLQVLLLLRLYYSQTIKPSQPSLSL
jgi:hypothetical protein